MLFVLICVIGLTLFLVKGIPQLLVRAPQPVYAGYGTVEYLPLPSTTPDAYPQALLELLERNPETKDFVLGYPQRGEEDASYSYEIMQGTMPHLLQWDKRWGYQAYGDDMLAINGCAPVCLAMVSAQLTGNPDNTPTAIAQMSEAQGYFQPGTGTSWQLLGEGCAPLGFTGREIPLAEASMKNALESGQPIICSVRPGDFTTAGHFIVVCGVAENGDFLVKDPNSIENTGKTWSYEVLSPQIKNLWAYSTVA